jgi:hypothetical protein
VNVTKVEVKTTTVNIALDEHEASVLARVLQVIGGCPTKSARRVTQGILDRLYEVGVRASSDRFIIGSDILYFAEKE